MKKIKRWNRSCATLATLQRRQRYCGRKGFAADRRLARLRRERDRLMRYAASRLGWPEVERRLLAGEPLEGEE